MTDQIGGLQLLSIGVHRLSHSFRVAKRALDIAVSSSALLVLAPLFALIGLATKLDSRGPVFSRQSRPGRDGEPFDVLKFRSMSVEAEDVGATATVDGAIVKTGTDPRVTRVGHALRRFSLDELPQLINILRGDMSLVRAPW